MNSELIKLNSFNDSRGVLIPINSNEDIPFKIERVFFIKELDNSFTRGNHAHFLTKQLLIPIQGECIVSLDNGKYKKDFTLNDHSIGLFQDKMIWGSMNSFSKDCILLVLANMHFDKEDYIYDYQEFKKLSSEGVK